MSEKTKTPDLLIRELEEARRRIAELEAREAERQRAEEALSASEERSRALLEGSPACTKIVDLDLRLQFMSGAGQQMLRISDITPFYGQPYADIYTDPYKTLITEHLERARAGEATSLEAPARDMEGREGWYYTHFVPVRGVNGQVEYIISTSIDITERRQAEEALIRSEKMAALGRLTAGVAHEILNPLAIVTMGLHVMIDDPSTPPEFVDQVRVLEGQSLRIAKIAQDLLSFARQRPLERRYLDFNETITRTLGLVRHDLRLQAIAVELRLAEALPPILADEDQIQQVILNLLTNARDAMPSGGRLVLRTEMVQDNGRQFVELRVEDTGEGIDPAHMDKLFDPFFTTKPEGEGTGLGLSICQGIVEAHGGAIWAEHLPAGGTAFVVRLGVGEE